MSATLFMRCLRERESNVIYPAVGCNFFSSCFVRSTGSCRIRQMPLIHVITPVSKLAKVAELWLGQ